jgi:hypothetical protein
MVSSTGGWMTRRPNSDDHCLKMATIGEIIAWQQDLNRSRTS